MSYARDSLGKSYEIKANLPEICAPADLFCLGGPMKKSFDIPFDTIFSKIEKKLDEKATVELPKLLNEKWPELQAKARRAGPTIISEGIRAAKDKRSLVRGAIDSAVMNKRVLFYALLGGIGLVTVYAIAQKRSRRGA